MNEKQKLIKFSKAVRESTLKRLRLIPDGFENFRPTEDSMSVADIAQHLVDCDVWLREKVGNPALKSIKGKSNMVKIDSRSQFEELLKKLEQSNKDREELINQIDIDDKPEERIFDDRFNKKVGIWWLIVRGNLDHEIHHRGQLSIYLKLIKLEHTTATNKS